MLLKNVNGVELRRICTGCDIFEFKRTSKFSAKSRAAESAHGDCLLRSFLKTADTTNTLSVVHLVSLSSNVGVAVPVL